MMKLKKILPVVIAGAMALAAWPLAQYPVKPSAAANSAVIRFEAHPLPESYGNQEVRRVAPGLAHISPWISAVGASVGMVDLRGLGRPGDACLTDPRDDTLKVFPSPGSGGELFTPFELSPAQNGLRWDKTMAPIGCVPADIDQDGRQDVIAYYWGRSPVIFRNTGGANPLTSSAFTAEELVRPMQVWNTTALNVADVNGDGILDIAVGNYFPDGARVLDEAAVEDSRMAMQHSMGKARNAGTNRLYLGKASDEGGGLAFDDVSERWPTDSARSWTLAMGFQDLSGNGRPDVYVANDFGPDQLLVNTSTPGDVHFTEAKGQRDLTTAKSKVVGHDSFKGMGIAYSYQEGDTLPHMFVSNITTPWGLHESNFAFAPSGPGSDLLRGDVPYRDKSSSSGLAYSGWSWDIKPIDVTNSGMDFLVQATGFIQGTSDMWPRLQEVAMGNDQILSNPKSWMNLDATADLSGREPNRLWAPTTQTEFADVGPAVPFEADEVSRGFAVGDVDGDGRDDMLVANQWGPSRAYLNRSETTLPSTTLYVTKQGVHGATPLIGATVTLEAPGYMRRAQLYPANGHSGVSGAGIHFAAPANVLSEGTITVQWMDSGELRTQRFRATEGTQEIKVG